MFETRGWRRIGGAVELAICGLLVTLIAVNALRRMDYLSASGAPTIRMTDASRSALVARNLVEGHGYTTEDLPAALVDFYDQRGKLHDDHWVNADRFPFAPYATAVLYTMARSTSWVVGVLIYNLLCFIGFLILLYHCGRSLWDDRYAGVLAVTIALLHPYTYQFLYWKDGDMLLLTTANMAMLYRYFRQPVGAMTWKFAVGLGTLLAWLFLSRPNLGAPLLVVFGVVTVSRLWRAARTRGLGVALRAHAPGELLVLATALAWVAPFVVYSMKEWGQPLFSANNLYQLPLGTRFGMGTDTWWKYTEPGHTPTLGTLLHDGTGELAAKFPSSWVATLKHVVWSYAIEILLTCGLVAWLRRPAKPDAAAPESKPRSGDRAARIVAGAVVFALVVNLAVLPLYGYQDYSYRHYLAFGLPLLWLACGRASSLLGSHMKLGLDRIAAYLAAHRPVLIVCAVAGLLAANWGGADPDANRLFGRLSNLIGVHWVSTIVVIALVLWWDKIIRPPWLLRIVVVAFSLVYACYRPSPTMKRANLVWLATDDRVWATLRQRTGLVSSFALQGEVAWNTGRKNIPAPEWPMHIYSFAYDHHLTVEDLYIESADALLSRIDGPFAGAAPGFEGYARLQRWRTMPGYEPAFHAEADLGYARFRIKPHFKASTVFRLVDRAAVAAMARSPDRIELSDPRQVIYTAHGWGDYYTLDGLPVVAGTGITRTRYGSPGEGPYEDASVTFFLDARRPTSVDVEFYAPAGATYQWFWNLDLYAYDRPADRSSHAIGTTTATPGRQTVHLTIPPGVTRAGLNKLGFRVSTMQPVVLCPKRLSDDACLDQYGRRALPDPAQPDRPDPVVVRPLGLASLEIENISMFARSVEFHY